MKKIQVNILKAGLAYDKPIYIDKENIFVDAYEPIKPSDLERLNKWNITELETDGQPAKPKTKSAYDEPEGIEREEILKAKELFIRASVIFDEIEEFMKKGVVTLNEAYGTIISENPYQISILRNLAEELAALLNNNPECFMNIYYIEMEKSLYKHLMYSAVFGAQLGKALDFSQPKIIELVFSIFLMDIGMMLLPPAIRDNSEKLSPEDKVQLQAHPLKGYQLLTKKVKVKTNIAQVAIEHQEHFDGSGYPRKLKGKEISEFARIAMIADSYSALLEEKSYRAKKVPYNAMREILSLGIYNYDPDFMKQFLNRHSIYPVGSLVELSDGSKGVIVTASAEKPMRPIVHILRLADGSIPEQNIFLHLLYRTHFFVVSPIDIGTLGTTYKDELQRIISKA